MNTITLADSNCTVDDLKKALRHCKKGSTFTVRLCLDDDDEDGMTVPAQAYNDLMYLCNSLYRRLCDARQCVQVFADTEKKTGENTIYYDSRSGFNGGARDLLQDIDELADKYHKSLVQLDLIK